MDASQQFLHSLEITVKDLHKLKDDLIKRRYRIIGEVEKVGANFFSLSDPTSKIGVRYDQYTQLFPDNLEIVEGDVYRVIGEIEKTPDNVVQVKAIIIQSLKNVDLETYIKVKKMKTKIID